MDYQIHKAKTDRTEMTNKSTTTAGNFNTFLLLVDRTNNVTTRMDIEDLNNVKHYIQK